MTDTQEAKRQLRRQIREKKPNLHHDKYMEVGRDLSAALMENADVDKSDVIVAFWPLPDEINTGPFIMECVRRGKRVYLPVIVGSELEFREFTGYKCLSREPRFGILEPRGTSCLSIEGEGEGVVVIAPGMAFSPNGARLGRGRGFYDRAFALLCRAHKIGVCYDCQMVDDIPTEEHDATMDAVVAIKTN